MPGLLRGTLRRVTRPRGPDEERVLAASPTAPALAREYLAEVCALWGRADLDLAQLLVTELVTNAVRHGAGPVRIHTTMVGHRLRVDVADEAPERPRLEEVTPTGLGGRGLFIVNSLANRWGVEPSVVGTGKAVWFEIGPH